MFLKRAGFAPHVFDAREESRDEPGSFVALAPNGVDVLDTLGVRDAVLGDAVASRETIVRDERGKVLARHAQRFLLVERSVLEARLVEAMRGRGIRVAFEKRAIGIRSDEVRAIATFEDGSEASGAFAVGCDGLRSEVRRAIMPFAPPPKYAGIVRTSGLSSLAMAPSDTMETTFGLHGTFTYQPTPGGVYWHQSFAQPIEHDGDELAAIPREQWLARLIELHRSDRTPIREILEASGPIRRWPIHRLPTLATWSRGRVCLIGDAAHASVPYLGIGGSLALEDAVVLAKCARDIPGIEDGFAVFERLRRPRVERLTTEAHRSVQRTRDLGFVGRKIRRAVLPLVWSRLIERTQRSLDYHVDWSERAWNVPQSA